MALAHETDHAGKALADLAELFKNKVKFAALIAALTRQAQAIEDAFWQLFTLRWLSTATGPQLDIIGRIVNQPRDNSANDDEYRVRIQARVRCNLSSGTIKQVYAIFRILLPTSGLQWTQGYPAGFTFTIKQPITAAYAKLYAGFLGTAKAAGVGGGLLWQPDADAAMFTCEPSVVFVAIAASPGDTTLTVFPATVFPSGFDPVNGGTILIDRGLSTEEELNYSSAVAGVEPQSIFNLSSPLAFAHEVRAAVCSPFSVGEGFSSTSNPFAGGELAGAIAS